MASINSRNYIRNYYTTLFGIIWIICFVNGQPCSFPGSPAHSSVTFSDESLGNGAVATYSCERGFELLGPARRVCDTGNWVPEGIPFCVLNVAAGKAPMQISTEAAGIPQKAIDGSTSAFYTPETCSLTKPERIPWWYVNLLEPYMVQLVRLDFGKTCCGNKPATIVVRVGNNRPDLGTNPICNRFTGLLEEGQPLFLPCNPPMPGAFVSVHLEVNQPSQLSICEAFVYTDQALPIERCPVFRDQPPGASASYNGKCYIFYNRQPLNFRDSLSFCRSRGGTLINESNPALQGFISWELWRRHRSDASSQYWMGAVREPKDRNVWKWVSGEEVTVSFWNLPGGNEDCARYDGSKGWLWSDTNCNTPLNYICQHQPKACGRPEQPPNSTMIAPKGFDVSATVDYSCDDGHLLVGPTSRKCLETGFYNEFPPVCKYIECGLPASIPHGSYDLINGTVGYLSTVIYKCNEGYEMLGRAMLTCDIDERWNGPPPRCEVIECDVLPIDFNNGKIVAPNGTVYGSIAEVYCSKGYKLQGARTIYCSSTGQWNKPLARCIKVSDEVVTLPTTIAATTIKIPETSTAFASTVKATTTTTTATATTTAAKKQLNKISTSLSPSRKPIQDQELLAISAESSSPQLSLIPESTSVTSPTSVTINKQHRPSTTIIRRPTRPSTRFTTAAVATRRPSTTSATFNLDDLDDDDFDDDSEERIIIPGTVREEFPPKTNKVKPFTPALSNGHANNSPPPLLKVKPLSTSSGSVQPSITTTTKQQISTSPTSTSTTTTITTKNPQNIILGAHPQDNEIASSVNIRTDQSPNVNIPFIIENDPSREAQGAKLNLGAIVALSAFSGFVFLAAVIGVIVCMVKKRRTAQHYRHRASPDCNTVASFDSSSSESRNGLNRYYRQAWENLHESASKSSSQNHNPLRRKETLDPPQPNLNRSRDNLSRSRDNLDSRSRDFSRDSLGLRDGSEMVVADVCVKGEKKRHHHHHHKSNHREYREPNLPTSNNGRRGEHRHNGHY